MRPCVQGEGRDACHPYVLAADAHTVVRFKAPQPGRYRFYCKYQQQEMQGWLTVK